MLDPSVETYAVIKSTAPPSAEMPMNPPVAGNPTDPPPCSATECGTSGESCQRRLTRAPASVGMVLLLFPLRCR